MSEETVKKQCYYCEDKNMLQAKYSRGSDSNKITSYRCKQCSNLYGILELSNWKNYCRKIEMLYIALRSEKINISEFKKIRDNIIREQQQEEERVEFEIELTREEQILELKKLKEEYLI